MGRRSASKSFRLMVGDKQVALTVSPASSGAVQVWFDLMPCGFDLSAKGEIAAEKIIKTYSHRGRRHLIAVHKTTDLQTWGDSIIFNCLKEDVVDLLFKLCGLVGEMGNLERRQ